MNTMQKKGKVIVFLMAMILGLVVVSGCGGSSGSRSLTSEYENKYTPQNSRDVYYTSRITKEEVQKLMDDPKRGNFKIADKVFMDKKDGKYEIKLMGKKESMLMMSEMNTTLILSQLCDAISAEIYGGTKVEIQYCEADMKPFITATTNDTSSTKKIMLNSPANSEKNSTPIALNAEMKKKFNTFFSNFSEVGVPPFASKEIPEDTLIDFGVRHNMMNRPQALQNGRLSAQEVDSACRKYFGTAPMNHHATGSFQYAGGYYTVPKAGGEGIRFSQVTSLSDKGDGTYSAVVTVFAASSGFTGNPHGTPEEWKSSGEIPKPTAQMAAVIKKVNDDGNERYILVDYRKQ